MKKVILSVVVIILIIVFILANMKRARKSIVVEATVVKYGKIISTVHAEGEVKAKNQVRIGSDVMGRILAINVHEGDTVKKGDTLCIIDTSTYAARVKQVRASLLSDISRLLKLKGDFERAKALYRENLISEAEFENIKSNFLSLKAMVSADSSRLEEALSSYAKCFITSPINGVVLAVHKEAGEMAIVGTINTPGSTIMDIADLSVLEVNTEIDETEITRIKPGQRVKVKVDAFPDTVFMGIVERISGVPSSQAGQEGVSYPAIVRLLGNPPLLPGMTATCDIIVGEKDSTLIIPFSALGRKRIKGKMSDVVFKIKGGKVHLTSVTVGLEEIKKAEILKGLIAGDTVAVGPYKVLRKLKGGERVKTVFKKSYRKSRRWKRSL